jgi:hypothetical protein
LPSRPEAVEHPNDLPEIFAASDLPASDGMGSGGRSILVHTPDITGALTEFCEQRHVVVPEGNLESRDQRLAVLADAQMGFGGRESG